MKYKNFLILLNLFFLISCAEKEQVDILILNANIVEIESGTIAANKMITISKNTISGVHEMEEQENFEPKETLDAGGAFIMPGLWDMHVHFRGGDSLIAENKDLLPLFLAHGITTVRDAGGDITPSVLKWRKEISEGNLDGPTIFTSGPKLDGPDPAWPGSIEVEDEEDIKNALDSLESLEVDYVKMYDGSLSKESFYNIITAAENRGLKTTGHMPMSADILKAIDLGLDGSEHLYYILKACSPLADSLTRENPGYGMMDEIIDSYDPELANEVFQKLKENNVYVTPTLHIGKTLSEILDVDHSKDSLLPFIGSGIQKTYQGRIEGAKRARESGSQMRQKMEEKTMEMMKPMVEAGVSIVAGSDCGAFNSYVYPGGSLLGEFDRFSDAGLSAKQILTASVVNGPAFFDLEENYGSVGEGKIADLVFLENNPLEDIRNVRDILVVIKAGKIYDRQRLNAMLEALEE